MVEEQNRKEIVKKELAALVNSAKTRALLITKLASAGSLLLEAAALGIDLSEIANAADAKVKTYENIKVQEQIREDQARSEEVQSLEKLRLLEVATFLAESERLDKQHVEFKKEVSLHIDTLEQIDKKADGLVAYLNDKNVKGKDLDFSKFEGILQTPEEIEKLNKQRKSFDKHRKEVKDHNKLLMEYNAKLIAEKDKIEERIEKEKTNIENGKYSSEELPHVHVVIKSLESNKLKQEQCINQLAPSLEIGQRNEIEAEKESKKIAANDKIKDLAVEKLRNIAEAEKKADPEKYQKIMSFASLFEEQNNAFKDTGVVKNIESHNKFIDKVAAAVEAKKEGGVKQEREVENQVSTNTKNISDSTLKDKAIDAVKIMRKNFNKSPAKKNDGPPERKVSSEKNIGVKSKGREL